MVIMIIIFGVMVIARFMVIAGVRALIIITVVVVTIFMILMLSIMVIARDLTGWRL